MARRVFYLTPQVERMAEEEMRISVEHEMGSKVGEGRGAVRE